MIKIPLWSFFLSFKSQSSAPLSIDQYFDFVKAIHRLPIDQQVSSEEDLYKLCKLFWLKKESEEVLFRQCFRKIFNSELLKIIVEEGNSDDKNKDKPTPISGKSPEKPTINSDKDNNKPNKESKDDSEETIDSETGYVGEKMVDFALIIDDSGEADSDEAEQGEYLNHNFNLWDQSIMPFDLRYFAQRLRRKVETSEYEVTTQLNIP